VASERDLLLEARQFDPCALAEIHDLYSPRLYRYAVRLLGDACMAEDCVAETFSRFLRALHAQNAPRDYLQAYLFRTIHNLIADYYRRQQPIEMLADKSPSCENIEESTDQNIRQLRIRAAMCELTTDQQQVIALKFLDGRDNEEIAHSLKKPVGVIKSLQHRALNHLQKILLNDKPGT
jgi:RNA polymerase sigma-70 factor (ECF subfamily)